MGAPDRSHVVNRLLRQFTPEDFARLAPSLEPVPLHKSKVLFEPHQPISHAFFFESGIASIISISPEGLAAESGLFGWDGVSPPNLAAGLDQSPHRGVVQVPGHGYRVPAEALQDLFGASPRVRDILLQFTYLLGVQTSYTSLSNAVHPIDERLARWLLMCHDRVSGDRLLLTHEFMSVMLAVRRPSVTTALHVLEGNRLIQAERGLVIIRDRKALEEFAGDAYGAPEAEFERLNIPLRQPLRSVDR